MLRSPLGLLAGALALAAGVGPNHEYDAAMAQPRASKLNCMHRIQIQGGHHKHEMPPITAGLTGTALIEKLKQVPPLSKTNCDAMYNAPGTRANPATYTGSGR